MNKRKASRTNLVKCIGFDMMVCRNCRRADLEAEKRLIMGMANGKCQYFISKRPA